LLCANVARSRYQRTETAAEIDAIVKGVKDVLHPSVLATMKKVRQRFCRFSFSGDTHDHLPRQARDKHGPQNAYQPTNKPTNKLTSYLGRRFAQVITAPDLLMLIAV
jgi:hypothetical protein